MFGLEAGLGVNVMEVLWPAQGSSLKIHLTRVSHTACSDDSESVTFWLILE